MERLDHDERPVKVVAGDRRLTMQLMGLWRGLRGTNGHVRADVFASAVAGEFMEDCFTVVSTADGRGELRDIGERVGRLSGVSGPHRPIADLPATTLLAVVARDFREALTRGAPILSEGEFADVRGRRVLYRSILLPLEDDTGRLSQVFGGARCKILDPQA